MFDKFECQVYYNNELVLSGDRDEKTEMWQLPINPFPKSIVVEGLDMLICQPHRDAVTHPHNSARFAHKIANILYTLP